LRNTAFDFAARISGEAPRLPLPWPGFATGAAMPRLAAALAVMIATLAFPLGLTLPLVTLDRLYFFTEEPTLLQVVTGLWETGDAALAVVVGLASIAFPAIKLAWLQIGVAGVTGPWLRHLHALGRWSMLDVLVVALVVFGAKTSGLAEAVTRPGLWFFTASALSAAVAALLIEREAA
jgi:paraquat-inducible protein A